jgi:hypothetical protein
LKKNYFVIQIEKCQGKQRNINTWSTPEARLKQARSYGGARWGSAPPESGNCPPPLEKLGHNYYILSKTYFLSIQKLNE